MINITSALRTTRVLARLFLGVFAPAFAVSVCAQTTAAWTSADVGAVGAAGSAGEAAGVITVRGAGEDVYGNNDEFHYFYQPWTGDGVFTVRVTSVENTFNWAKAGLMLRTGLTATAQHAYAFVSPEQNTALIYRPTDGGNTTAPTPVDGRQKAMPMWLKLTRVGSQIAMDYSFDGRNWLRRGSATIDFPANVFVGLAVNSHVDARLNTSTFDHLLLDSVRPTQLSTIARSPTRVFLRWQDNDLDETGFEIERSTDNVNFARIGTAPAWAQPAWSAFMQPVVPPQFTDETAAASTTYYYRVRSVTPRGTSAYSNVSSVTTPAAAPAGWSYEDVGDTSVTGTSALSGGTFTVAGAGSGVGTVPYNREAQNRGDFGVHVSGFADEFQYCWKPLSGEGEIVARLTGLSGSTSGHAGVMVRTGTPDASAFNAFCFLTPTNSVGLTSRPGTYSSFFEPFYYRRETYSNMTPVSGAAPLWLKLVRITDGVIAYRSSDGASWTYLGWVNTPLQNDLQFGLGVSSKSDGTDTVPASTLTATFDNVSVGAISTPVPAPQPPTNLLADDVRQTSISLVWTNPPELYDGVEVQVSTDGANFTRFTTTAAGRTNLSGLLTDTNYYFRLRTLRGSAASSLVNLTVRTTSYAAAPSNLVATAVSSTEVDLTWTDNATNEDGFQIEKSSNGSAFNWVASAPANTTSARVSGLTPGTTYSFRMLAYPSGSPAAYSNTASATTSSGGGTPPAAPSNLMATATSATRVDMVWTDNSTDETSFEVQRSTDGTTFAFVGSAGVNNPNFGDATVNGATTYYYRVRALRDSAQSAFSNVLTVTTPTTSPTGGTWQSADIGAVGAAGNSGESGGTVTINASGADIWNSADEFHYRFQAWSGDGMITARLASITGTHNWAKGGVMFRESSAANARHAFMCMSYSSGSSLQYRTTAGGETANDPINPGLPPRWVRLIRAGSTFSGYDSPNGVDWTLRGTITISGLGNEVLVGLAATSHNDGMICTATFDNVTVSASAPPSPTPVNAPSNLAATAVSSTRIDLTWTDNASDETEFVLERSLDNVGYTPRVTLGSNVTSFVDTTVSPATQYYYRVKARRGSSDSNYSNVANATTAGSSAPLGAPTNLVANGVSNQRVELTWTDNASDETGFQLERGTDGTNFTNIGGTGANNTQFADTNVAGATTYYYRVRARRNEAASEYSNVANATTPSSPAPGVWQSQDIGFVSAPGSSSESGGRVFVTASGADIWNAADEFHYRYQAWNGDGEIIARVTALSNTNGWAKAGVMFRETLTDASRHALMCVSIAHGTAFQYRATTGGDTATSPPSESGGIQQWVRLVRSGNTFTGYSSLDGVNWTLAGSTTIALPTSIFVGFAVTSHNDGVSGQATFENVSLSGGGAPSPTPPNPPTNLAATAASSSQINLSWTDASNNETGFEIESSTDNTNFTRVTTTSANATSYAHTALSSATTYFYRVRAINGAGNSAYTAVASATTQTGTTPAPGAWDSRDIGAVAVAGRTDEMGTSILLTGSGADIWNTEDEFRYRYQAWTGDGEIITRVTTLSNTFGWAKAGLMFRATLDPNSRHASMFVSSAHGTAFQYRAATGGESGSSTPTESGGVPRWLKLTRSGNTFTGSQSFDGTTWFEAGSLTLDLPAAIYVGCAVTSHNDGVQCTATFETIDLHALGSPPPGGVNPPTALSATSLSNTQIQLRWTDNSGNETAFQLERSTDNSTFTLLASFEPNTTDVTDGTVSTGTTYFYRVRAVAGSVASSYSNVASASSAGPWSQGDIGAVGVAGSNDTPSINSIRINASGADIWDTADAFRFVYRAVNGDCTIDTNVSSLTNTHAWAKAGVMIRESAAANARNVFVFLTPTNGAGAQARASDGATTSFIGGPSWLRPGAWLRLVRAGNHFTAFWSSEGTNWTQFASFDGPFSATAQVGFAVTSHNNAQLATAVFVEPYIR